MRFAPAGAPAPAQSQGMWGLVVAIIGHAIMVVVTVASMPRVWRLRQVTNAGGLLMPLLLIADNSLAARRVQCWLLASVAHSLTVILHTCKDFLVGKETDHWKLFFMCFGPLFIFVVSVVLLVILFKDYPGEDLVITIFIIASGAMAYLLIALTDITCLTETNITFGILLIPVTICMHILRFVSQGTSTQFEMIPLVVAFLGIFPGVLCLIPFRTGFIENVLNHLPFKIATLIGAVFRFLDVILICCSTAREAANYFRSRLQECFI